MKLTLALILVLNLQSIAGVYSQTRITLSLKDADFKNVISAIEKKSSYRFVFSERKIPTQKKVDINVINEDVLKVLDNLLRGSAYGYTLLPNQLIAIVPLGEKIKLVPVTGRVIDEKGEPLIGATVKIKGASGGVSTGTDGSFTMEVTDNAVLVVSYLGYQDLEVAAASRSPLIIQLTPVNRSLNEIVVVGYGTQKRENLTGAIASVSPEKLEARPLTNLGSGLQGLIPNLNINRGNGQPGQNASFNVRGTGSTAGTDQPLILVDGIQMDPNIINPLDIDNITVLKDAASAAIYGGRGAFGVILITTKTPKKNAPVSINYSGSYTTTRPTRMPQYMNSVDYVKAHRDADRNGALAGGSTASEKYTIQDSVMTTAYFNNPAANPYVYVDPAVNPSKYRYVGNTDWIDVLYPGRAPMNQHNLSLSGGGKTSFAATVGYFGQDGLMEVANDKYKRYNTNLKVNSEVTPWLDLNFRAALNRAEGDRPTPASHGGMSTGWIPNDLRPTMPVYHPDGKYSGQGNFTNMVALATLNGRILNSTNDLNLSGGGVIKPLKNIRIVSDFTWQTRTGFNRQHAKEYSEYGVNGIRLQTYPWSTPSRLIESNNSTNYYVLNAFADYEKTFGTKHYLKAMIGYNQEYNHYKSYSVNVRNLVDQEKPSIRMANDPAPAVTSSEYEWALNGSFSRINYIFDEKYLLEVNGRYDGTSRYKRGNRYTFNPSVSAGWRISQEGFFKPLLGVVNDLKIRASYGTLPNQLNESYYPYISTLPITNATTYIINGTIVPAVNPANLVREDFTWEKVTTRDLGVDLELLNSRISGSFDVFIRDTKDMLAPGFPLPSILGATVPQINSADLRTRGWELSLTWRDKIKEDFTYDVTFNLSDYTSKITRYDQNPNKLLSNFYVGRQIGEIWGFETAGFFKTDAEAAAANQSALSGRSWKAGDIRYADLNGDGKINQGAATVNDPGDQKIIGNSTPRYQFGVNLGMNFKGFDFSAFVQGVGKRDFSPSGSFFFPFGSDGEWDVPLVSQLDYWTPANQEAYYPRLRFGGDGNYATQTKYIQNAAYARMKNITLGYNLPVNLISKAKFRRARVYISGENLFEVTKLNDAFDPELVNGTSNREYPYNRALSFGIQVGL